MIRAALGLFSSWLPLLVIGGALYHLRGRASGVARRGTQALLVAVAAALLAALAEGSGLALTEIAVALGALIAALSFAIGTAPAGVEADSASSLRAVLWLLGTLALLAAVPAGPAAGLVWAAWLVVAAWLTRDSASTGSGLSPLPLIGALLVAVGALVGEAGLGPWLVLLGSGVAMPLFPLHGWYLSLLTEGRSPERILVAALLPVTALILLLGQAPPALAEITPLLTSWGILSLVYAALRAFAQNELRRVIALAAMASAALVAIGVGNASAAAYSGAALQALSLAIVIAGLALLAVRLPGPSFGLPLRELGGLAAAAPRLALVLATLLLALMQTPALGGFAAWWLVLMGSQGTASLSALAVLLLLSASVVARLLRQTHYGEPGPLAARQRDLAPRELALFGVFVAADLVIGLAPTAVLSGVGLTAG